MLGKAGSQLEAPGAWELGCSFSSFLEPGSGFLTGFIVRKLLNPRSSGTESSRSWADSVIGVFQALLLAGSVRCVRNRIGSSKLRARHGGKAEQQKLCLEKTGLT